LSSESFVSSFFKVFPNPVENILNVKFHQVIKSIQIFNVVGQQVFDHDYHESELQIDLAYLSSGTYLIKVLTADSNKTFRVVKN